jgi:geranylgeranyl diphosphate synthase type II
VEDGSEKRRELPTLHSQHGVPIAVNVGDAMLALAMSPLLENTRVVGLGKALRILQVVSRMAQESAAGQATELAWVRRASFEQSDASYIRMVHQKTGHYSFIAPVLIGAIVGNANPELLRVLARFGTALGIAFQIQDDLLNIEAPSTVYGKEFAGDLWEGKHTLVLLHALRNATRTERARAARVLAKPRLRRKVREVAFLLALIRKYSSADYARRIAQRHALRARSCLAHASKWLGPSEHAAFLQHLTDYITQRDR